MPTEVTVSITYDMDEPKSLQDELKDWVKGRITVPDVVHGNILFHYNTGTKAWTSDGSVISIKAGASFQQRKPLSVEELQRLAAGNWSGKWWW